MSASQRIAGRFLISNSEQDLLGRGSMGEVYRATDTHTGELVAVKALDPRVVARDPGILERFAREGEALRQLDHPNIVRGERPFGHFEHSFHFVAEQALTAVKQRLVEEAYRL